MNHPILLENQKKRSEPPLCMLICFAMFCFWQMGFIYFMGPSLAIDGRTPLPIDMDNVTMMIVAAYVLSIAFMSFLPHCILWLERITAFAALLSVIGLYFHFDGELMRLLIYVQAFCCCFMIGFETFLITNYFTERVAILHLTVAYGIAVLLTAIVQNDFIPLTFSVFRSISAIALVLQLVFFFRLSTKKGSLPRYVKKEYDLVAPKKLMVGTYLFVFVGALMAVSGPAITGKIRHGVFLTYIVDAVGSILIYLLYKKRHIHPTYSIPFCISLGGIGFLLMFASAYVPSLALFSCGMIGLGMIPCQMIPLFNVLLMKSYPSRYLVPFSIFLALVAVLVQSSLVEIFRCIPDMLSLVYALIMAVLAIIYLQLIPFLLYTLSGKFTENEMASEEKKKEYAQISHTEASIPEDSPFVIQQKKEPLSFLSKRELEVTELLVRGYSNSDIAKMLFISEHTVKDHTKHIYRKMNVHSRFELAALVTRLKNNI